MSFTYDVTDLDTALAQVRLEIGDTVEAEKLFDDEEIEQKLSDRADNVLLTAADLCEILARRFAQDFDFSTDNQSFKRSQRSEMYRDLARDLRNRATSVSNLGAYRVDAYSDDLDNRETSQSEVNARRRYYGDPDRIP